MCKEILNFSIQSIHKTNFLQKHARNNRKVACFKNNTLKETIQIKKHTSVLGYPIMWIDHYFVINFDF